MKRIDLHMHSNYSDDGEFSPKELLCLGKQAGLSYLSITDHNCVRAVSEAQSLSGQYGIQVITGVELDCVHEERNFHLLGYGFDHMNPAFAEIEQSILTQEQTAARKKIKLFQKATDIPLSADEVLKEAKDGIVTGELIAEILLQRQDATEYELLSPYLDGGARSDNPYVNFYWDYFSQGKPAYVPVHFISLAEGVELFHDAGGIAVLAHPGQNLKGDYAFLEQIIETGIDGIEAYSSYHGNVEAALFDHFAQQHGLLVTCGSDFHGKTKPSIPLGGHRGEAAMPGIIDALKAKGVLG